MRGRGLLCFLCLWAALNAQAGADSGGRFRPQRSGHPWALCLEHLAAGRYPEAVGAALDYLDSEPQHFPLVESHFEKIAGAGDGNAPGQPQQRTAAIAEALHDALDGSDRDPLHAAMLLAAVSLKTGEPQVGLEALLEIERRSDIGGALYQFASRCEAAGFYEVAALSYQRYSASPRGNPRYRAGSLLKEAGLYERQGRHDQAMSVYRQVADRYPREPESREAIYRQGRLLLQAYGDAETARLLLAPLAAGRGGYRSTDAVLLLAECDLAAGDLDAAGDRYRALLAASAGDRAARYGLGRLAYLHADFEAALAHFDTLLAAQPGHELANDALEIVTLLEAQRGNERELALYATSLLYQHQGRHADAATVRRELYGAAEGIEVRAMLDQARACEARALPDSALAGYAEVAASFPGRREALTALILRARLLEKQGRPLEALRTWESALLGFPGDARAPQIRLEIQRLRPLYRETG